jgi:predicted ArsR family transcriptional regulator
MLGTVNENPTREKIIMLLKKHGPMPIEELSKALNITSMGIRQHLLSLERKGLIDYVTNKKGIGRPAFLYKLTQDADNLFPKSYHTFIIDTLKDIETNEGREKVDELFKWRRMRLLKDTKEILSDIIDFDEKVYKLKNMLETKGYIVELDESENSYTLKEYNCPIFQVAFEYKEACKHELQLYKEVLGKEVKRQECMSEGDISCTYKIPKR